MTYIIPKLEPLFESTGVELPLMTQALIGTSRFIENNFIAIIIVIIIAILLFQAYSRSTFGRYTLDSLYLRLPVIGTVYRNYIIVRVASTLSLLLESGIPIIKTLDLTAE